MSDLERAFEALKNKQADIDTLFDYAEGRQPLRYSTKRLQEAFKNIDVHFEQNWCSVVIDAAMDRVTIAGWDTENKQQNDALDKVFKRLDIGVAAYNAHYDALVAREGFIIAWKNDAGEIELYHNSPSLCHMFYDENSPNKKSFAAKWYREDVGGGSFVLRMILYYPERIEYYNTQPVKATPDQASAFEPSEIPVSENTYGAIPVFHFRTNRRNKSDLQNILTLQDAVNKLLSDMMVAAEYGAYKQRYIISNTDTTGLRNSPNMIWSIPSDSDGKTQVGEFSAQDLDTYLNAIDKLANSVAIISRTPKHYFFGAGANLSGEALLAMEAPLTKKVEQIEANLNGTWRELGAFILQLETGQVLPASEITPIWSPPESVQPFTEAQTIKTLVDAQVPLVTAVRMRGWDQSQIDAMLADVKKQKEEETTTAIAALERARINSEQNNEGVNSNVNPQPN